MVGDTSRCPSDVIFVLDESNSVNMEDFDRMKSFVSHLVSRMDVNSENTRVGLVCFSNNVTEAFNLITHASVASIISAITSLNFTGGYTYTSLALRHVRENMLTPAAGDRDDVPNVVIILTDGKSIIPDETEVCTHAGIIVF